MQRISFSTTNRDIMVEISKQVDHKDLIEMRQTWQNKSAIIATPLGQQELGAVYINSCVNTSWWVVKLKINIFGTGYIIIVRSDYLKKVKKIHIHMVFIQIWVFGNSWRNIRKTKLLPVKKMLCLPNVDSRLSFSRIPTKKNFKFFYTFLILPPTKKNNNISSSFEKNDNLAH